MLSTVNLWRRAGWLTAVFLFAALFAFSALGQTLYAAEDETSTPDPDTPTDLLAADLSESAKMVNFAQAVPGQTLAYTIVLTNSENSGFANVYLTDTLPMGMVLLPDSITFDNVVLDPVYGVMGNVITVTDLIVGANSSASMMYHALVSDSVAVGDMLTNTAVFFDASSPPATTYTRTAVTEIISATADFSGSTKTVDEAMPRAGEIINYTVVVSNSGDLNVNGVEVIDTLPTGLSLTGAPSSSGGGTFDTSNPQQLLWSGSVNASTAVVLTYQARVGNSVAPYSVLTNSVTIKNAFTNDITRMVSVEIEPSEYFSYLPFIAKPLPLPTSLTDLASTRPNSGNSWTLSWTATNADSYEIQESQDPNFGDVVTYQTSNENYSITKNASYRNVYYYRARAVRGSQMSDWSNRVEVIGGYYDNFENQDSGWAIRRTTLIDDVNVFYEAPPQVTEPWLVMVVADRWDWGIASPLMPAPEPPYVIEFRGRTVRPGNLTSGGAVFAGDWNGDPNGCINYATEATVYEHEDCFNQFYFPNNIWFGGMKTQWERIDQLEWCPSCGNSPMKRGRYDWGTHPVFNVLDEPGDGWHVYRIEVRENEIRYFVDGGLRYTDGTDVRYINENPYFGIGATTDEYQPSVWRFTYYSVMPLDN